MSPNLENANTEDLAAEIERRKSEERRTMIADRARLLERIAEIDMALGYRRKPRKKPVKVSTPTDDEVLRVVKAGAATRAEIAGALNVQITAPRGALERLVEAGKLQAIGDKRGRRYLPA